MDDVSAILGRDALISESARTFQTCSNSILIVTGPSGAGKSQLASLIGGGWTQMGGITLYASGDPGRKNRELFPFNYSLQILSNKWAKILGRAGRNLASAIGTTASMVVSGAFIPQTVTDGLIDILTNDPHELAPYLRDDEAAIIQKIKRLTSKKQPLLIADEYQYWDLCSTQLFEFLHVDKLREVVPQISQLSSIIVTNDKEDIVNLRKHLTTTTDAAVQVVKLDLCTDEQFKQILRFNKVDQFIDRKIRSKLSEISGGHLDVIDKIVFHLTAHGASSVLETAESRDALIKNVIRTRIERLHDEDERLIQILRGAAYFDTSFTLHEIVCILNESRQTIMSYVNLGKEIGLIQETNGSYIFSHEGIRDVFLKDEGPKTTHIAGRYAECLATLAPGEYGARSDAEEQCAGYDKAGELAGLELLRIERGTGGGDRTRPERFVDRADREELNYFVENLRSGYRNFRTAQYRFGLQEVQSLSPTWSHLLEAERAFLECLLLMEQEDAHSHLIALQKAGEWGNIIDDEFEIGIRFQLLQQQIFIILGRINDARKVETSCMRRLAARQKFDEDSRIKLAILERKSDAIYEPEIAKKKVSRSVHFFHLSLSEPGLSHPQEYYRSVTNLMAVLIKLRKDQEATAHGKELENFMSDNVTIKFPRKDVFLNNYLIAAVNTGLPSADAAVTLEKVARARTAQGENFIHLLNTFSTYMLAADLNSADRIFQEISEKMHQENVDEPYINYYYKLHKINYEFHCVQNKNPESEISSLFQFIDKTNWPIQKLLVKRCNLVRRAIQEVEPGDVPGWEKFFSDKFPKSKGSENYYGRGFPLCELQFWSET